MKNKIKGCTHHETKVISKYSGGGLVGEEKKKAARLDSLEKSFPDERGALPVTVIDRKTGKIDERGSIRMRARNEGEGLYQELDRKYPNAKPLSARYKAKDDRKR